MMGDIEKVRRETFQLRLLAEDLRRNTISIIKYFFMTEIHPEICLKLNLGKVEEIRETPADKA